MKKEYEILFNSFKIKNTEIKNRFVMAAMGTGGMTTDQNAYNQKAIDYFVERAKGGTGLIITGTVYVENEIEKVENGVMPCPTTHPGAFMKTASEMTERIHAYDAKIFLQLTAGFGRVINPSILDGEAISSSEISNYWDENLMCRALTKEEIETIIEKAAESAVIAKQAGFDGIEIHAVHEGYLLDQFAIKLFNNRTDEYGGDLRGRLKFACDIVKKIKEKAGNDYPVILRYSLKSCIKGIRQGGLPGEEYKEIGRDIEEGIEAAKILEEAGYDAFDVDAGTYDSWYWSHPPMYHKKGMYLEYADILKKHVNVPVIVAGRMENPDLASDSIITGKTDAIAIGRGLLADPYIPNKIKSGKHELIKPCLGCHEGCMGRLVTAKPISCAVNPVTGREGNYGLKPVLHKKDVMIIGGGVAGMEAARVLKLRGHNVEIFEKSGKLGGALIPGGAPDFKEDDRNLIKWYERVLKELKIKVYFNKEITEENINNYKKDIIIVATGSKANKLRVPCSENEEIINAEDVLIGTKTVADSVVIVGGGLVGCELALDLAQKGKKIYILEMLKEILASGSKVPHMNKIMLEDLLKYNNVEIITEACIKRIKGNTVIYEHKCEEKTIQKTSVVSAVGYNSNNSIYKKIYSKRDNVYIVGDARKVKNIMYAIWDAYELANNI